MNKNQFFSIFFLAFFAFAIYQLFRIFAPFLETAFWAFILVFAFYPVYDFLERKFFRGHRFLAALVMTLLICLIIVIPLVYLVRHLSGNAFELYHGVKKLIVTGSWRQFVEFLKHNPLMDHLAQTIPQLNSFLGDKLDNLLLNATKNTGNFVAGHVGAFTKDVFFYFFRFLILIVFVFFFLADGKTIYQFCFDLIPLSLENRTALFATLNNTFTAIIRGQFLTSVIQAVAASLVFLFLNIQPFLFLGLLTFVSSLVPFIGAAGIWVPIDIYFFVTGDIHMGILLLIGGTVGISSIDHVTKPLFIGQHSKMPFVLIFFGILGGISVYGVTGAFIGPIVVAIFFTLIEILRKNYLAEEKAADEEVRGKR